MAQPKKCENIQRSKINFSVVCIAYGIKTGPSVKACMSLVVSVVLILVALSLLIARVDSCASSFKGLITLKKKRKISHTAAATVTSDF